VSDSPAIYLTGSQESGWSGDAHHFISLRLNSTEAAPLAAHYRLNNLIAIVDVNRLGQSQATMYQHDVKTYANRFEACGWKTLTIDGHDMEQIITALDEGRRLHETRTKPFFVVAHTVKGKGVSFMENKIEWHGVAPKPDEAKKAIAELKGVING